MSDIPKFQRWDQLSDDDHTDIQTRVMDGVASLQDLAAEYNLNPVTLERRLRELKAQKPAKFVAGEFERHWKLYCRLIGRDHKHKLRVVKHGRKAAGQRKVAVVCDLHGHPHRELVRRLLAEQGLDLVVYDGDLLDNNAASSHPRLASRVIKPITKEIAQVRALLEVVAGLGIAQQLNAGNHDDRLQLYFSRAVSPEFLPLCQFNVMELIAAKIPNVTISRNEYNFQTGLGTSSEQPLENDWITHLGDAVIGHSSVARKGEGASVRGFYEWVGVWRKALQWVEPALVLQAHVHRAAVLYPEGAHVVLVEGGFGGDPNVLQWQLDRGGWGPPPAIGYTIFEQKLIDQVWRTDKSSVRFVMV